MAQIIDGKTIAERINTQTKIKVSELQVTPRLAIVLASNDPSSHKYVELKMKIAKNLGIETKLYQFEDYISKQHLISEIRKFRNNEAVTGVLIQVPFFEHLQRDTVEILNSLTHEKDADGLTAIQQGLVSHLLKGAILPAAVEAILECLNTCFNENLTWDSIAENYNEISSFKGKEVVILNNTNLVGKPLSMILSTLGATVTIANVTTPDIKKYTQNADIIISATNQGNLINHEMIKQGAILIDVTSREENDKVIGDFIIDEQMQQKASFITPVPGGVGPLTVACLLRNLVR